ncbi:hypothetical protein Pmani_032710 [Petrolisthes manimaculis]|uniref:Uncharacterized protein n=1 Tax=Petrolisthes manimaculis TaxID=1843537 RepID=A0AAE1NT32_9EUCA|nr:hypothetical protein Pmani_032710 [Petrolisthes manimaculis]
MHSALAMSRLESLDKVDEICQTCIDTLNAAQLRYQEYMTTSQCDQLIQQVLVYVDQIKQRDQSEDVLLPITASPPTNTPEPSITASPPTNTPEPSITASPPTNTPEPSITTGQSIDHQGTPSMTDQPSEYYGLKLIKMHWFVLQPCMYHILCLGTQMKPSDKNFIEYLKDLPQPSTACGLEHSTADTTQPIYNVQPLTPPNYKPGDQRIFNGQQKKIRIDLDGKGFDIALLHPCIMLGCVGVAPRDDPVWRNEGTELENCLYMIKKERNDVMHETLKLSASQFLEKVEKLREIIHNTLIATQHRYVHSMSLSECNQYKEKVDKDIDNIKDERLGIDELQKHSLPMLLQIFIPEATHELKEKLKVHNVVTLLDFVKSCDSKEMCLKIQNIFTRVKMVKGKEQASQTHMDYRKLLTWIQAKAKGCAKDKEEEEEEQQEEEEDKQHEGNEEEQQEDEQHECNEEYTPKPQMLILEGSAGMEHLVDFIQIVPSEYEKNVVELTGIQVDLRTEFMKKYFQEIKRVMGSKESGQELVDKNSIQSLTRDCKENYAALHILKTFQKDPQNTIIPTMENTLEVKIENFKFYLNMFKHLAGLLDLEISNPSEGLIWEIVELIEKAGESSQNAWLDILEEVKLSEVFLKAIARCFPIQDGIVVKETRAAVYSILLPHLCPAQVIVDIRSDPTPLLPAVTNHTCTRVELWHHWYHPNNSTSQLRNLLSGDSLRVFRGHGTVELDRLPASLKELMIAISEDNQARSMLPLLMTKQMHLQHLEVHVTTKVSTEAITNPLPDVTTVFKKPGVSLILSNVKEGEEGWVCEVAAKLQPSQG